MSLEQQEWQADGGQMPDAGATPAGGSQASVVARGFLFLACIDSSSMSGQLLPSGGAGVGS